MVAAIVLLALALALPAFCQRRDWRFDLPIIALTATMVSPIAWEHHYGVVLPLFAVLVPASLEVSACGRWTAPLLAVSFLLTAQSTGASAIRGVDELQPSAIVPAARSVAAPGRRLCGAIRPASR